MDRFDRKRVLQFSQIAEGLTAVFLAWGTYAGWLTVPEIFLAMLVVGTAGAFRKSGGATALLPAVVPTGTLQPATATSSGFGELATIARPALGGFATPSRPVCLTPSWPVAG